MVLPAAWPPRPAGGRRSIRFYQAGTATADFADNAYMFKDGVAADTYDAMPYVAPGSTAPVHIGTLAGGAFGGGGQAPEDAAPRSHDDAPNTQEGVPDPMLWAGNILIRNLGTGRLEFSFDGTAIHGRVNESETVVFKNRFEAGIAIRGVAAAVPLFEIEAW